MQDRRKPRQSEPLPADLVKAGTQQLEREIAILEDWLKELDETRGDNPESLAARQRYGDMLQSRRDLLETLKNQTT